MQSLLPISNDFHMRTYEELHDFLNYMGVVHTLIVRMEYDIPAAITATPSTLDESVKAVRNYTLGPLRKQIISMNSVFSHVFRKNIKSIGMSFSRVVAY